MELDKMKEMETKIDEGAREKEVAVDDKIVQLMVDGSVISLDDFQENDKKVLSVLNQDADLAGNLYTFNGLARKLGMHQQSLSRSLHRLESSGLVEKGLGGYRLGKNLRSILVKKSMVDLEGIARKISRQHMPFYQVLQTCVPDAIDVEELASRLAGKWFANLRWLGLVDGDGGRILQWAAGDKFQVNLRIVSRYAIVESNAAGDRSKAEAMVCACRIFEQMTKIFEKSGAQNGLGSFSQYN